jgi:cytochrome c5
MLGKTGSLLCGAMMTVAAAFVAAQGTPQSDKGEQVMNASCLACHDLRPIQVTALNSEGWSGLVAAMVDRGAQVNEGDVPVLVEYLARTYGPLPDGAGKKILLNTCTICHDTSESNERPWTRRVAGPARRDAERGRDAVAIRTSQCC